MTHVPDTGPVDRAGDVRRGEEVDLVALHAWLASHVDGLAGTPRLTQYPGGASNWTYRLEYDSHDLIVRRPPAGTKAKSAHDMGREYRLQRALRPVFPYVPEMLAFCEDPGVIGAEFYVMRRIPGIILRRTLPPGFRLTPDAARTLCVRALDTLIALHQVDHEAAGLAHLAKGAGYIRRQIDGWSQRYRAARTWNVPRAEAVMTWLAAHLPGTERICLTHNDYRFDNIVLDPAEPSRVIGVLDWELATLGDPLMDVGNMLAYWAEAGDDAMFRYMRRQPTTVPGMLTRREILDCYARQTGLDPGDWTFYEVYGLFRLAAIYQQIYFRFHRGETTNPAFRHLWTMTTYLQWRCGRLIRAAT